MLEMIPNNKIRLQGRPRALHNLCPLQTLPPSARRLAVQQGPAGLGMPGPGPGRHGFLSSGQMSDTGAATNKEAIFSCQPACICHLLRSIPSACCQWRPWNQLGQCQCQPGPSPACMQSRSQCASGRRSLPGYLFLSSAPGRPQRAQRTSGRPSPGPSRAGWRARGPVRAVTALRTNLKHYVAWLGP